jgi:peptide-methionine (R)-S-oxide reductase
LTRRDFTLSALAATLVACQGGMASEPDLSGPPPEPGIKGLPSDPDVVTPITKTEAEWKAVLDKEAYNVLREQGTERPFTGRYWNNHAKGLYACAGCGLTLFKSDDKFESGTGWPSFTRPIKEGRLKIATDNSLGMTRDEVSCARCGGHMGHVFDDGPPPTGKRYCMDSVSLIFRPA